MIHSLFSLFLVHCSNLKEMRIRLSEQIRRGSSTLATAEEDVSKAGASVRGGTPVHIHTTGLIGAIIKAQLQHGSLTSPVAAKVESEAAINAENTNQAKQIHKRQSAASRDSISPTDNYKEDEDGDHPGPSSSKPTSKHDPLSEDNVDATVSTSLHSHAAPLRQALKALGRTQFKRQDWSKGRTKEQR